MEDLAYPGTFVAPLTKQATGSVPGCGEALLVDSTTEDTIADYVSEKWAEILQLGDWLKQG